TAAPNATAALASPQPRRAPTAASPQTAATSIGRAAEEPVVRGSAPRPTAEVYTVHPDVRAGTTDLSADARDDADAHANPVDVRRPRDPMRPLPPPPPADDTGPTEDAPDLAVLRAQLRAAQEARDRLAERVDRLQARAEVPVVTDVREYQ